MLVHGRHVFAGTSGRASTALGAAREGRVAVHEGALLDGLLRSLKDFVHIPVGEGDAMNLGTNGRPITPDVYVTGPAFRRIGDAAGKHGVAIEYVEFSISNAFGGACRCGTQALWRE